jgi:hypothetical protein
MSQTLGVLVPYFYCGQIFLVCELYHKIYWYGAPSWGRLGHLRTMLACVLGASMGSRDSRLWAAETPVDALRCTIVT